MLRSQVTSPRSHRLIEVGGVEGVEDVRWTEKASLILSLACCSRLSWLYLQTVLLPRAYR